MHLRPASTFQRLIGWLQKEKGIGQPATEGRHSPTGPGVKSHPNVTVNGHRERSNSAFALSFWEQATSRKR